jgi:hypothetical protein
MTPWSAPGSTIRYYQCPFCARTHSSLYGEVFRRRAGARFLDAPPPAAGSTAVPMPSQEDMRWARVKASAARWFARLEEDERRLGSCAVARPLRAVTPAPRAVARPVRAAQPRARAAARPHRTADPADCVPEVDPRDVIEIAPGGGSRKR